MGSSDASFLGNASRWNPEDLLVASVSACHQLWYLHLCAENGISVTSYTDNAQGEMVQEVTGAGRFATVSLSPVVEIQSDDDLALAIQLHGEAHAKCFIGNSVNFAIECHPVVRHARPKDVAPAPSKERHNLPWY